MDITKYPQFHLFLLTLHMLGMQDKLIPNCCNERCVNATIINRAYYSSYLYYELWLEDVKKFKTLKSWEFGDDKPISQHKQVRNALFNFKEIKLSQYLGKLFELRKKADYEPFIDLTQSDVTMAIEYMENIFNTLKFE